MGDVVTVQGTRTGINQTAIITSRELRGGKSFKMNLELSDFTSFYPYTSCLVGHVSIGASGRAVRMKRTQLGMPAGVSIGVVASDPDI